MSFDSRYHVLSKPLASLWNRCRSRFWHTARWRKNVWRESIPNCILEYNLSRAVRRSVDPERTTFYFAIVLSVSYAVCVCAHGIPALRHDWLWPRERYGFIDYVVNSTSGWSTIGIGAPAPYPGAYIVGTCLGLLGLICGPLITLVTFLVAIGISITFGARALVKSLGASNLQAITLAVFALCNPWVYNETVAGHIYMLLAYGVCFSVLAELLRPSVRPRRLALLFVLLLPQLQFFLIAMIAITIHAFVRRIYLPWLTGLIVALPIWTGLVFDRSSLLHIPYTLAWEESQSVPPVDAPILMGYFANYAAHFAGFQTAAVWAFIACACLGAVAARQRMLAMFSVVAIALFMIAAMGTRGALSSSYAGVVLHFPESGLFRELYDLLAFVAIGYCVLIACVPSSNWFRFANLVALLASMVMATGWIAFPPSSYWDAASQLPHVKVVTAPDTRFALYPAYQPMQFNGNGSGADPDAYARPGNVSPINEYLAQYPIDVALSSLASQGDANPLEALSTSLIVQRPWLDMDVRSLRLQFNGAPPNLSNKELTYRYLRPLPLVALQEYPKVGSLVNILGEGNIHFADARDVAAPLARSRWRALPKFFAVQASNEFIDERGGWIDVRFDFVAHPELGQGLGGAVTTSDTALLPVRGGIATLINVKGELRSRSNRLVSRTTDGYQWVRLAEDVTALRCAGRCVVAAQAAIGRVPPLNPGRRRYQRAIFTTLTPWLVRVEIPGSTLPVLRYNVAYDPNWDAVAPGKTMTHLRLDATINGWLLPNSRTAYAIYIIHRVALSQAVAEMLGALWVISLIMHSRPRSARPPETYSTLPTKN